MRRFDVVILGSGIAGLTAGREIAKANGVTYIVFEKAPHVSGAAASFEVSGYTFDYGIHGLYTKDQFIEDIVRRSVAYKDQKVDLRIVDLWNWHIAPHPIQSHLGWLPKLDTVHCLTDYVKALVSPKPADTCNFGSWARATLGNAIAERFLVPYAEKFWATDASSLSIDWIGSRVRIPGIAEVIQGAVQKFEQPVHYVHEVMYPKSGGFGGYGEGLANGLKIAKNCEIVGICPTRRSVTLIGGEEVGYRKLISTLPLPELCKLISNCPEEIMFASKELRATSLMLISFGLNFQIEGGFHWAYSFDQDCPFARLSIPSMWSEANAPKDVSSIQVEVYFIEEEPVREVVLSRVIDWLRRLDLIRDASQIVATDVRQLKYANVVYDMKRERAVSLITKFLDGEQILRCGRYANWDYSLVSDVISGSMHCAQRVLSSL